MNANNNDKTLPSAAFGGAHGSRQVPMSGVEAAARNQTEPESQSQPCLAGGPPFIVSRRFVERELIGRGGMGTVIRAFDRELGRDVAIKVLTPDSPLTEADVESLMDEARIASSLEHPNILPVYELGVDDRGAHFLCMKLVRGETLEETLSWAGSSRLEPHLLSHLLEVFVKVCDAVAFAHSRGVLHRDIKPSNVMISDFGQVHVLDWGVARWKPSWPRERQNRGDSCKPSEEVGIIMGTPHYMAPEQLRGLHHQLDERSDVFALGATLYQILTGEPPHLAELLPQIAMNQARVNIVPPNEVVEGAVVPVELSRIALKAMAHDPADRYWSVDELRRDVERFQSGRRCLRRKWLTAGSIIEEEDEKESAYVILEGRCTVFVKDGEREIVVREMVAGDVFRPAAVVSGEGRTASARALTAVVVLVLPGDILPPGHGPTCWATRFVHGVADRIFELEERVFELERQIRVTGGAPTGGPEVHE